MVIVAIYRTTDVVHWTGSMALGSLYVDSRDCGVGSGLGANRCDPCIDMWLDSRRESRYPGSSRADEGGSDELVDSLRRKLTPSDTKLDLAIAAAASFRRRRDPGLR